MRAFVVGIYLLCAAAAIGAAASARAEGGPDAVDGGMPSDGGGAVEEREPVEEPEESEGLPTPSAVILSAVQIDGPLLEPAERLARFLGLTPGAPYGAGEAIALPESLEKLGYTLDAPPRLEGTRLVLVLRPLKVVRSVRVRGNFPLFDDEILRQVSFTSGDPLPPDELIESFVREEASRVSDYLGREGYFGNKVEIERRPRKNGYEIDLVVRVDLGGWARPYRLEAVRPQGNRAITDRELLDVFSHGWSIWGRFSLGRMREDARRAEQILKDKGYPGARVIPDFDVRRDADPTRRRISLPMKVTEKRRVEVHFVGNRAFAERELRQQLTIFTTGAYDEIGLNESARALERFYQQNGHFEAKVSFRRRRVEATDGPRKPGQPRDPQSDIEDVTFLVDEGPELRVRDIEVVGEGGAQLAFNTSELIAKAGLETKVFPRLGAIGLGAGGYVTEVQLHQDEERLVAYYASQGFPHAKARAEVARDPTAFGALGALGAASAAVADERGDLYVRFYVEEGKRELCEGVSVEFVGPHVKSVPEIEQLFRRVGPGRPYTPEGLSEDLNRVTDSYKSLARPYVQADYSSSSWNEDHTRYTVRLRITEGPEVRFGEILIRGNFTTRDRVILLDLPFKSGDPFDINKLEQGRHNLQTHLLFSSVKVTTPPSGSGQKTVVPILVTVRERYIDYGSALASAGVSSDRLPYYAYVSLGYIWSNFFGFGSQIEVRGDFGFSTDAWGTFLRYSDPRVFGPNWRLDANVFVRSEVTNRLGTIFRYGASLAISRFITPRLRSTLRYDFYVSQTAVGLTRLPGSNEKETVPDNTKTGRVLLGLVWDRRVDQNGAPNPLAPYKGWLLQGQIGWASPYLGGDNQFLILAGQALVVQPFRIRTTGFSFVANLRYDQGIPFDSPALPAVERYFAGGDTATRGYETDQLKVEVIRSGVPPLPGASGFRIVPQGGNIRLLSTLEVQFPIARTFLGLPFPWVGAIFYDAGSIFDSWNTLKVGDIKHSIGVSFLRLQTPIGPISLEYAYPLNQGLSEERWKTNPWYSHFPGRIHFNWSYPVPVF